MEIMRVEDFSEKEDEAKLKDEVVEKGKQNETETLWIGVILRERTRR